MSKEEKNRVLAPILGLAMWLAVLGCDGMCRAEDWPQWRGPNRDGVCSETGLLDSWPEGGPRLLWEISGLGKGYSSFSIVDGKLYTMGDISIMQCILAYDLSTRQRLWIAQVGPPHKDGPRGTPTVDDGLVYAIGSDGDVVCVDAGTGKAIWSRHFQKDLGGGKNPHWKFSESPLDDGVKLLCTPGGRDAVMVALDKKTGELIWKCSMPDIGPRGKDEAGYSSIVATQTDGVRQYVQLTNKGLIGVAADDGRFLWGYNKIANDVANVATPVLYG
ncbi:MAG: PQQ-binding-like beta-propeller repeat protein, partial [Woeseiaceae bacterium]|nr:PQQ-binding-like beta-propeller repeat protein [Woeseiaceae bacterium]